VNTAVIRNPDAHFRAGIELFTSGQMEAAIPEFQRVIALVPRHLPSLTHLGIALSQTGRQQEAITALKRAIGIDARHAVLHYALGGALLAVGDFARAVPAYRAALAREPTFADAANGLGVALKQQGDRAAAAESFRLAIRLKPDSAEAHSNLGSMLLDQGDRAGAVESLCASLALRPHDASTLQELAAAAVDHARDLLARGDAAAAAAALERALMQPGLPDQVAARLELGTAYDQQGRALDAIALFESAVGLAPDSAIAHYTLGSALHRTGRLPSALLSYDRALAIDPSHRSAHAQRGFVFESQGQLSDAIECFRTALSLGDDADLPALAGLVSCGVRLCDFDLVEENVQRLRALDGGIETIHPFVLLSVSNDPAEQLRAGRATANAAIRRSAPLAPIGAHPRHERLRVAYVSPDFREHPVAILLAPLLERHDRSRFEVIGIALNPPDETPVGQRVRAACDQLHVVWEKSDAEVAQMMRELEIDIAVDMAGFTTGNRTAVFASRPAPLQVSYLGFAGSMGASYIDYVVADPVIAPPEAQPHYAEAIVRLPDTYQVNDTHYSIAEHTPSRAELGLPERGFVFCCFNNSFKLTADVFAIWMRLLSSVPDSVLWLAATRSEVVTNLRERARALGVDPSRLVFAPRVPDRADHLARYRHADLFLDTLPFNAHATATDALWCGVPVLTATGATFAGRVGTSLLRTLDVQDELVCDDLQSYEARALELARDPARLAALREKIARNRPTSQLFDTDRFRRHIEAAYEEMWCRYRRGERPASFGVPEV
jgi:predicted O-linked N-acetylglucosamine transferase (SPINDLY family)